MPTYPIIKITTGDGLVLHGLLTEPSLPSRTLVMHIHGAAGNFYGNSYFEPLTNAVVGLGFAYLSTNNRGAGVYELEAGTTPHGVSLERFDDCVRDIDAWIELVLERGYERVILEGHSFGTEKIVYYMRYGTYRDRVGAIILFGFSDNVGSQAKYESRVGRSYLEEARELERGGEAHRLLDDPCALCGELPISAGTYLNCFTAGSANANALPLRQGRDLTLFRAIEVPILRGNPIRPVSRLALFPRRAARCSAFTTGISQSPRRPTPIP